ncbi:transposase InsO family protein [Bradyrhizobium sp. SBR1B]|nr:transposase InsO family protein [Bradyrhizobium sp. SBR1B]
MVIDAFSRRVIGWALETHLKASLAIAALATAIEARRPMPGSLITPAAAPKADSGDRRNTSYFRS